MKQELNQPAWNIESEYASIEAPDFRQDELRVQELIKKIGARIADITPELSKKTPNEAAIPVIQEILLSWNEAQILTHNLSTWLYCALSVNAIDEAARAKDSIIKQETSKLEQLTVPIGNFMLRCDESAFAKIVSHAELKGDEFDWRWKRRKSDELLSDAEETLLKALLPSGFFAWDELYTKLSGTIKATVQTKDKTEVMGLAKASALKANPDQDIRKAAWQAVNNAWIEHRETAAQILNSLAGWRHEVDRKRSQVAGREIHFLESALHSSRISRETLAAMMTACHLNIAQIRRAPTLMAKLYKKNQLDPWDLLGPSPVSAKEQLYNFDDAAELVAQAYNEADPKMGDFARMMVRERWIEGRVLPNKITGGYCTEFAKSLQPRIYMTYNGSLSDISTLAHELGHAYHSWAIRDLPRGEQTYPMTLAETASVFGEAVLRDHLAKSAKTKEEKIQFGWEDLDAASSFLINIPARYEFEKNFYERRLERELSADELSELTDQAWSKWYGPTLSQNDKMYWASKLHFSIARVRFYNFPYTFGYLFSMSLYARRKKQGAEFMPKYVSILRDTGRMSAEDLIQKHLGEDIRRPEFWQAAIDLVVAKIDSFERSLVAD